MTDTAKIEGSLAPLIVSMDGLHLDPKNARLHNSRNIEAIKYSLATFSQRKPIVADLDGKIIAGNGTFIAAKSLGWKTIAATIVKTDDAINAAYAIADNRTAELAEWDFNILSENIEHLNVDGFSFDSLGFSEEDLENILKKSPVVRGCDEDEVPEHVEPKTKPGDLYQLGNHRLLCGDSTNVQHVEMLMGGESADMVFTDPPYGIEVVGGGKICKPGIYRPIQNDDSTQTAIDAFNLVQTLQVPSQIWWGGNYYAHMLPASKRWIVWDKNTTGNFADCELAWTNLDGAVRKFEHTWNGLIKASEHGEKRQHPTQKPIALAAWCFEEFEKPKSVLDLFLGSGSTLVACEKTNRRCFGMEIDGHYCDVIIARWEKYTGKKAVLLGNT